MRAGDLKDRITILTRSGSGQENVYGTGTTSWIDLAEDWAWVQDVLPSRSEQVSDQIDIARFPARVRMRYRNDITPDMRLRIRGREMGIIAGPAVIENGRGIELLVQHVTTEGDED